MESINPPSSKWNHNDDIMLVNAVEAGASLESLARGAVHFSQAYTLQEIKERWLCLLYDPTVSSEFIDRGAEVKPFTAPTRSLSTNTKRKHDSVRGLYYNECRKHRRSLQEIAAVSIPQPVDSYPVDADQQATVEGMMTSDPVLDSFGIELDAETSEMLDKLLNSFEADSTDNGAYPFIGSKNHGFDFSADEEDNLHKFQGQVPGFGQCGNLPFGNFGASGSFDDRALSGLGCSSSSMAQLPFLGSDNGISGLGPSNLSEGREHLISGASAAQRCGNDASRLGDSDATLSTEDYIAEFADRLLNLSDNEDADAGPLSQSYLETFTSLVSDNPDTCLHEPVKVPERDDLGASGSASGSGPGDFSAHPQHNNAPQPTARSLATSSAAEYRSPENRNCVIICTLNQEDPEIPDNDDVFLPFILPMPHDFWRPPWLGENEPLIPFPPSFFGCSVDAPEQSEEPSPSKPKKKTVNRRVRFDLPKSNDAKPAASRDRHYGAEHARRVSEMNAAALSSIATQGKSLVMEQRRSSPKPIEPLIAAAGNRSEAALFQWDPSQAHEGNGTREDEEETWAEGDFDVPCFSDVEAMILNMDLVLDKRNLLDDPEVQQLQLERTKRTLIRLEQAAESCSQRVIAAHGAFAILFGHFSWHFIKKPEVLIGRAIDGIEVDIDLGLLEMGTKVSRRQAVIKIGAHGTFMIKNVGKKGIYVNGVDVLVGRWHNLTNSSVIEIRGLDFIFKINQKLVQEHLNRTRSEAPK